MGEMSEEWRNSMSYAYTRKVTNKNVENYRGIILLNACYELYSKMLKEELKTQAGISFRNTRMDAERHKLYRSIV